MRETRRQMGNSLKVLGTLCCLEVCACGGCREDSGATGSGSVVTQGLERSFEVVTDYLPARPSLSLVSPKCQQLRHHLDYFGQIHLPPGLLDT